jgi:6-phosphogluconolactonase
VRRRDLISVMAGAATLARAQGRDWLMFAGTYSRRPSKGIYAWRFDSKGALKDLGLAAETSNPSFLALSPRGYLYSVNEDAHGAVSAFAFDRASGKLRFLNTVSSKGDSPCHVSLDRTGRWLFTANYNSGSVAAFPVKADGSLGEAAAFVEHHGSSVDKERQTGPHAHMALVSEDNRLLFVPDLGLDQVMVYRIDAQKGTLAANSPAYWKTAPGFGPRHMTFGKDLRFAYVLGELAASVCVFGYDAKTGGAEPIQTISMLPADFTGPKSGAEVAVHPNGQFLYASNRGHDSIAIFRIDPTGKLTAVDRVPARAKTPRNFAIDPSGEFLLAAGQDSNAVAVFRIDGASGRLTPLGDPVASPVPVSLVFAPAT